MTKKSVSERIVSFLTETDELPEFDVSKLTPDEFKAHVAALVDAYDKDQALRNPDALSTLKRQVKGYIEWTMDQRSEDEDEDTLNGPQAEALHDIRQVAAAETFEEVWKLLEKYEHDEIPFSRLVKLGYF